MRLSYFGDGPWGGAVLQRLYDDGHDICAVVVRASPSDQSCQTVAQNLSIPVFSWPKVNAPEVQETVRSWQCDLAVSMSYDQIIREPLLSVPTLGFINGHAGLLPRYRGRSVINWAIINGETEIGVTIHQLDEGIDTGDVLLQERVPIGWEDDYGTMIPKVAARFPDLMSRTVHGLEVGELEPRPHPAMGTYYPLRGPGDEWLDWSANSESLYNKVRGLTRPGPGARTTLDGTEVIVWGARYDSSWPEYRANPGQVSGRGEMGWFVKTGDSLVEITEYEIASTGETPPLRIGTRFDADLLKLVYALRQRVAELEYEIEEGG